MLKEIAAKTFQFDGDLLSLVYILRKIHSLES
jgi:hypothetical protein